MPRGHETAMGILISFCSWAMGNKGGWSDAILDGGGGLLNTFSPYYPIESGGMKERCHRGVGIRVVVAPDVQGKCREVSVKYEVLGTFWCHAAATTKR